MARYTKGVSGNPEGRPKGALSRRSQTAHELMLAYGLDPVAALCELYHRLGASRRDTRDKVEICRSLLPYAYPRLTSVEVAVNREELEAEIDRELDRLVALSRHQH